MSNRTIAVSMVRLLMVEASAIHGASIIGQVGGWSVMLKLGRIEKPLGEARNALARAVFFNRLGEIRDRSYEQQRYRASGLNGKAVNTEHLKYLSPLGWEHINLTGDYTWKNRIKVGSGKFRPLRGFSVA
jgi:hypothetical protein